MEEENTGLRREVSWRVQERLGTVMKGRGFEIACEGRVGNQVDYRGKSTPNLTTPPIHPILQSILQSIFV